MNEAYIVCRECNCCDKNHTRKIPPMETKVQTREYIAVKVSLVIADCRETSVVYGECAWSEKYEL